MKPTKYLATTIFFGLAMLIAAPLSVAGNRISEIKPISVPSNLDVNDVKAAMVQTILKDRIDTTGPSWRAIVDNFLSEKTWNNESRFNYKSGRAPRGWGIENVEESGVLYACKIRSHYLQLRMNVVGDKIVPKLVSSVNLYQDGDKIHANAVKWMKELTAEIGSTLGEFSSMKAQMKDAGK